MNAGPDTGELVDKLTKLGFSQYEARAYVGLLMSGEQTGYALSKVTDVPQPKVYETLRRLVDRRAAVQVTDDPARFVAIPAERVLTELEDEYLSWIGSAREDLDRLPTGSGDLPFPASELHGRAAIVERAAEVIADAAEKVYLSGKTAELTELADAVIEASSRGVEFVMLHFGRRPFALPRGASFAHVSTEGRVYRRHQARHLAVVADSCSAVWGLAGDGRSWRGMSVADPLFAAALKGYIRHDVFLQRICGDLGDDMQRLYGPSLQGLTDLSGPPANAVNGLREESNGEGDSATG